MKAMRRLSGDYRSCAILAALAVATILFTAIPSRSQAPPMPEGAVEKIQQAMPARATAVPAQPRRVLVFNRCEGYYHGAIPTASRTFEIMGDMTGAFATVMSDDMAVFNRDTLRQFDAVRAPVVVRVGVIRIAALVVLAKV